MSALQIVYMAAVYFHRLRAVSLRHDTKEEKALPMSVARFRKQSQELLLLAFLTAVIPSVGCSTSRQSINSSGTESARVTHSTGMAVSDESATLSDTDEVSPIQMVAHQAADPHNNEVTVIGEVSDETDSFAAYQDAESPPVPYELDSADGLTLEALEQLALANNPAIQQAAAVAARARGIRNQVGLKPNPSVGYLGAQLADAGTDQNSIFIEQTFVRGDKLA